MSPDDLAWVRLVHAEARAVLEASVKGVDDVNSKAAQLFTYTPILLTLFIAGLPFAYSEVLRLKPTTTVPTAITEEIIVGIAVLGMSTVLSILAYGRKQIKIGLGGFEDILSQELDEEEYLRRAAVTFEADIVKNAKTMERAATLLQYALYAIVVGIGLVGHAAIRLLAFAGYS